MTNIEIKDNDETLVNSVLLQTFDAHFNGDSASNNNNNNEKSLLYFGMTNGSTNNNTLSTFGANKRAETGIPLKVPTSVSSSSSIPVAAGKAKVSPTRACVVDAYLHILSLFFTVFDAAMLDGIDLFD